MLWVLAIQPTPCWTSRDFHLFDTPYHLLTVQFHAEVEEEGPELAGSNRSLELRGKIAGTLVVISRSPGADFSWLVSVDSLALTAPYNFSSSFSESLVCFLCTEVTWSCSQFICTCELWFKFHVTQNIY